MFGTYRMDISARAASTIAEETCSSVKEISQYFTHAITSMRLPTIACTGIHNGGQALFMMSGTEFNDLPKAEQDQLKAEMMGQKFQWSFKVAHSKDGRELKTTVYLCEDSVYRAWIRF